MANDSSSNGNARTAADELTPFERFERLAKEIVNVPKAELDDRRKQLKKRVRRTVAK